MSIKKKDIIYKIGEVVIVNYDSELDRKTKPNEKQQKRQGRLALIVNLVSKPIFKDFSNDFGELFRYEVIVGKEKIEIDQACLMPT